jgi:predicted TIM-barrel fold metal-dependent hydrolase
MTTSEKEKPMGRFGHFVIDADGHGGEPLGWRKRIPDAFASRMREYVDSMRAKYTNLPGSGVRSTDQDDDAVPAQTTDDDLEITADMRPGMYDPEPRMKDMDDEGIDVAVLFPPGSGEEWALGDVDFSVALCRTLNDARAEYASHDPDRLKLVAKLPMIEPKAAAEELERCVTEHGFVGLVTATHIRDKNLDDPSFDPVWEAAERLNVAVCTHGGGQAPGQTPLMIDRFDTRLGIHAMTHPLGAMQAVMHFTVGGIWARYPGLRVGFMEAGVGWLPFWLERLDEHWEMMADQAPLIDRAPSTYFEGRGFLTTEPDEKMVPYLFDAVGSDIVCYSSDYCHWDCAFPNSVKILEEREDIPKAIRPELFAGNAAKLYNLEVPS